MRRTSSSSLPSPPPTLCAASRACCLPWMLRLRRPPRAKRLWSRPQRRRQRWRRRGRRRRRAKTRCSRRPLQSAGQRSWRGRRHGWPPSCGRQRSSAGRQQRRERRQARRRREPECWGAGRGAGVQCSLLIVPACWRGLSCPPPPLAEASSAAATLELQSCRGGLDQLTAKLVAAQEKAAALQQAATAATDAAAAAQSTAAARAELDAQQQQVGTAARAGAAATSAGTEAGPFERGLPWALSALQLVSCLQGEGLGLAGWKCRASALGPCYACPTSHPPLLLPPSPCSCPPPCCGPARLLWALPLWPSSAANGCWPACSASRSKQRLWRRLRAPPSAAHQALLRRRSASAPPRHAAWGRLLRPAPLRHRRGRRPRRRWQARSPARKSLPPVQKAWAQ